MKDSWVHLGGLPGLLLIVCVLLIPAAMLAAACYSPQISPASPSAPTEPLSTPETPSEQPSDTTMRPTATWTADGVISSGEYTNTKTYDDFRLNWKIDEKYIYIGLNVKTSGWVALGIQPGSGMKNADMVLGFVSNDKATCYDQFSTGDFGPHPPDTELGGTDDILEFGGKEIVGYTIIEFKRALDTGDRYDHPLLKGVNKIIWAYGSDDQTGVKHSSRGYGELDL